MNPQERMDEFKKRYEALVDELKVDFIQYPMYIPDSGGGFRTIIQNQVVDMENQSTPSPFVSEK